MYEPTQTIEAAADAKEIGKYVSSVGHKRVGYAHYVQDVQLASVPSDWELERVHAALIDWVDGGWSPFGGSVTTLSVSDLKFRVKVYTD